MLAKADVYFRRALLREYVAPTTSAAAREGGRGGGGEVNQPTTFDFLFRGRATGTSGGVGGADNGLLSAPSTATAAAANISAHMDFVLLLAARGQWEAAEQVVS